MNVVFRVDASLSVGTGHVMRCLNLAEELRRRGVTTHFVCRDHPGNLLGLLKKRAMRVTVLPAPEIGVVAKLTGYQSWLGVAGAEDAKQTIEALNGKMPNWLIVDHYGLGFEWEELLRPHAQKIAVIDDLADRNHDCDVLLDQNFSIEKENRYLGLLQPNCRVLSGPRYAMLSSAYRDHRKALRDRNGQIQRVLVYFGGSDALNMTEMVLEALSCDEFRHLDLDLVVGANYSHSLKLNEQANQRPRTTIYGPRDHLADLMQQADLAIGAGGVTTWERMCLGLPSLVIRIAENQKPACDALAHVELIECLGDADAVRVEHVRGALKKWLSNADLLLSLSTRCQLAVDGLGLLRVVEGLYPTPVHQLYLRPAPDSDALFLLMAGELPVGQIKFEEHGDELKVSYSLDALVRERNWDARLIAMATMLHQQSEPIDLSKRLGEKDNDSKPKFARLQGDLPQSDALSKQRFSIAILSDVDSWINEYLEELVLGWLQSGHRVQHVHSARDLRVGDFCFYLGCSHLVPKSVLSGFQHNLVVHESDLPKGRGWSPLTWQILEGKEQISVALFEATEAVDSGVIYALDRIEFEGHELIDELRKAQARATLKVCKQFVDEYPKILDGAKDQVGEPEFYPRRYPRDSVVDPEKSISEQFASLRVADPDRYPNFFSRLGHTYKICLTKHIK